MMTQEIGKMSWEAKMWLLITLIWLLPFASSVRESRNWCYADDTTKSISCNDSEFILEIVKAYAGVSRRSDTNFCEYPMTKSEDCVLGEHIQTEYYRKLCNGFSTCSFVLTNQPQDTCQGYYGNMHVHIEYECHPIYNNMRMEYPVMNPCSYMMEEGQGDLVRLRSAHYPSTWQESDECHCSVRLKYDSVATIYIRDMAHDDVNNEACPFYMMLNSQKICALRGKVFQGVDVQTTDDDRLKNYKDIPFTFYAENGMVKGRYWIDIKTVLRTGEQSNAIVHCGKFGIERESTTTIMPSTTPPTTTKYTTVYTAPPTSRTSTVHIGQGVSNIFMSSLASTTGETQESVTSQETTKLSTTTTNPASTSTPIAAAVTTSTMVATFKTSTTSTPEVMEAALDLKVIVGGAAAGGVLVILIIVFLAVCLNKNISSKKKKKNNSLGYSVHANVALAQSLNSRRHGRPPQGGKSGTQTSGGSTIPPHYSGTLERQEGLHQYTQNQLASLPGHSYVNVPVLTPVMKHKSKRTGKSASQITLNFSSNESLNSPDLSNNIFAGFPRWSDSLGTGQNTHTYCNVPPGTSSTLPSKLNKRPMPLPKPKRHKSSYDLARRPPVIQSNIRSGSMVSLGQSDYGTGRSTEPLYSIPNKKTRYLAGITIVENDMYGEQQ